MGFQQVSVGDLQGMGTTAGKVLEQVRASAVARDRSKAAPTFTSVAIAELCGIARDQLKYLTAKYDLPAGLKIAGSRAKAYSLEDAITFVQALAPHPERPLGKSGKVLTFCNHKNDVGKTSTAVALAQAMTLRGFRVLIIDCDVQGAATRLCGIGMERQAINAGSLMPYLRGDQPNLRYAVVPTYWHNLSLIPASSCALKRPSPVATILATSRPCKGDLRSLAASFASGAVITAPRSRLPTRTHGSSGPC